MHFVTIWIADQGIENAYFILQIGFLWAFIVLLQLYTEKEFAAAILVGNCYFSIATGATMLLHVEFPFSFVLFVVSATVIPRSLTHEALYSLARLCNRAKLSFLEKDIRSEAMRMDVCHFKPHPEKRLLYVSVTALFYKLF